MFSYSTKLCVCSFACVRAHTSVSVLGACGSLWWAWPEGAVAAAQPGPYPVTVERKEVVKIGVWGRKGGGVQGAETTGTGLRERTGK